MGDGVCCVFGVSVPRWRKYCNECYRPIAVYRFVAPDGRSYVGSSHNLRTRLLKGLSRSTWACP
jgi:hypothetical protein